MQPYDLGTRARKYCCCLGKRAVLFLDFCAEDLPQKLCSPYLEKCAVRTPRFLCIKCNPYSALMAAVLLDFCAAVPAINEGSTPRFLCIKCSSIYVWSLFWKIVPLLSVSTSLLSSLFFSSEKWKVCCPFASLSLFVWPKWVSNPTVEKQSNPTVEKQSNPTDENQWE